jgi:dTDP-4-dehydrorhamnose reductase
VRRVLIVGGDSVLGRAAAQTFAKRGDNVVATTRRRERIAPNRPYFDLSEPSDAWPKLEADVAFLFASDTSIARCEHEPAPTAVVNVTAPANLARRLIDGGAFVCIPSSTLVFSGERAGYLPGDAPAPACEYGRQKRDLEDAVRAAGGQRVCIIRLGKVVSPEVALFGEWMSALARGRTIRAYADMVMAPVALSAASDLFARIADAQLPGTFHFTARQDVTYEEAASELARRLGAAPSQVEAIPHPDTTIAAPTHTMLDSSATAQAFGIRIPAPLAAISSLAEEEAPIHF